MLLTKNRAECCVLRPNNRRKENRSAAIKMCGIVKHDRETLSLAKTSLSLRSADWNKISQDQRGGALVGHYSVH